MKRTHFFKRSESVLKLVSVATMLALPLLSLSRWLFGLAPPAWLGGVVLPVLTAAAVGYLTNYIAIEMLFKPYSPADNHWLKWLSLGLWRQGLVSANKAGIGKALGQEIPRKLLKPEEISRELCEMAAGLLHNRQLLDAARIRLVRFLRRYSQRAASFLVPYLEEALRTAVRENLTADRIRQFWDDIVGRWLADGQNVAQVSTVIAGELQRRCPELTLVFKDNLREMVRNYLANKYAMIARVMPPDVLAAGLVNSLDWRQIEAQIHAKLGESETVAVISGELTGLSLNLRRWLETPAAEAKIEVFLAEGRQQVEGFLRRYLDAKLPVFASQLIDSGQLWEAVERQVLPAAQTFINNYLKHDGRQEIIDKLNLSGRIEAAIDSQDVKGFHEMINQLAAEHLGEIQVLGYVLGAIAGFALLVAQAG